LGGLAAQGSDLRLTGAFSNKLASAAHRLPESERREQSQNYHDEGGLQVRHGARPPAVPGNEARTAKTANQSTAQTSSMAGLLKHFANAPLNTALNATGQM
jgi:hypothetical protein